MTIRSTLPWPLLIVAALAFACADKAKTAVPDAAADTGTRQDAPADAPSPPHDSQAGADGAGAAPDSGRDLPASAEVGPGDTNVSVDAPLDSPADASGGVDGSALEVGMDATGKDTVVTDGGGTDVFWAGVRFCTGTSAPTGGRLCRTVAECGPTGPVVCSVGPYDWGPAGCPLPPTSQPCPAECNADSDCTARAGGKCVVFTRSCPRCDGHTCSYPPPPCTTSPDSCGTDQRCGSDGTCGPIPCTEGDACASGWRCNAGSPNADRQGCEPIPCTEGSTCAAGFRCAPGTTGADLFGCVKLRCDEGYACPAGSRCNVASPRADERGCEYVPCKDGYDCPENTRCTEPAPASTSHGCTTLSCKSDGDCDCGYCVGGACSANPGTCQFPPV